MNERNVEFSRSSGVASALQMPQEKCSW